MTAACAPDTDMSQQPTRGGAAGGGASAVVAGSAGRAMGGAAGTLPSSIVAGSGAGTIGAAGGPPIGTAVPSAGVGGSRAGIGGGAGASAGNPGLAGAAAVAGVGGALPSAGAGGSKPVTAGTSGGGTGTCGDGTATDGRPTTGPLACIVEQHNAVRAMVMTSTPLPPVTWSAELAKYAQEWTDMTCMSPRHRSSPSLNGKPLGENLYASSGFGDTMAGKNAVEGWAGEVACYTFGKFMSGDKCDMTCTTKMNSDGCGHYTQVVWRTSTQIGCGVTTCGSGFNMQTEVICNYAPAGNYIGENPY